MRAPRAVQVRGVSLALPVEEDSSCSALWSFERDFCFCTSRKAAFGFLWCARPSKRELLVEEEIKQFRCLRFVGSFVKSLVFLNKKKKKTKLTIFICHVAQEKCSTKNDPCSSVQVLYLQSLLQSF